MANEGLGKDTSVALVLNGSDWETGDAEECGANSGFLVDDQPILDERPIKSAVSLGQDRASSWIQSAIALGGDFKKKFRFGGKDHQLFAGALGTVGTLSFRSLTKTVEGTATGGSTTSSMASVTSPPVAKCSNNSRIRSSPCSLSSIRYLIKADIPYPYWSEVRASEPARPIRGAG